MAERWEKEEVRADEVPECRRAGRCGRTEVWFQGCQVPALPGNEWDLRVLIPMAVQCFVSGKLWASGYRQM